MAKRITLITVRGLNSAEACACMHDFAQTSEGDLLPGVSILPTLSALPLTWTLRVGASSPIFPLLSMQINRNDPRVTLE